ncbi:MAG: hypothetical protein ACI9UN_000711 [Granulosicoccus sp.]|jgi:hypothetical protein
MKIQLSSTLPFTPVQLDARHVLPRRAVGQLMGVEGGREFRTPVYEFRHSNDDVIHYQIDRNERVYLDELNESDLSLPTGRETSEPESVEWIEHSDDLSYKPYSFLVMNAMTKLVANWDGVVYRTPRGERLRETALNATLQVIDACVCNRFGLWGMVNLTGEKTSTDSNGNAGETALDSGNRQLGWVPL